MKTSIKNPSIFFQLKVQQLKMHFHKNLPCRQPVLRQTEWGLQNAPVRKNGILPLTCFFFFENLI